MDDLVQSLVPPPHFDDARFDTYLPDPAHPGQAAALAVAGAFVTPPDAASRKRWFRRAAPAEERPGIYFDGGFGVGKTHLLAAVYHASEGPKAFGTFVEFTNLVGALGFQQTVTALSGHALVCIDEFELDDPGDTVLMSSLLMALTGRGVRLAATSNTLPDALGEGRFAADDFLREIQGLSAHFDVVRIEGVDYRHRGAPTAPTPLSDERVRALAAGDASVLDAFPDVWDRLAQVHPSRYGALVDGIDLVGWTGVGPVPDQSVGLRLVVLVDRLYDRDIPVAASGVPLDQVFPPDMLRGGYRKKYFRAISRLTALARLVEGG